MRVLRAVPLVAATMLLCSSPISAQDGPARFLEVVTVTVQPGTGQAWSEYRMRVNDAAGRLGDGRTMSVLGGAPNRYKVVTSFNDYAEVESWRGPRELLREAFGEDEAARIVAPVEGIVTDVDITVRAYQPDFTGSPDAVSTGRYLQLVTTTVEPYRSPDYAAMLRAVKTAEDSRGINRQRRTNAMGTSFTFTTSWRFESMANRGLPGPGVLLREQFGEEIAQGILDRANAAVQSRTFEIWEFRPELGYSPG